MVGSAPDGFVGSAKNQTSSGILNPPSPPPSSHRGTQAALILALLGGVPLRAEGVERRLRRRGDLHAGSLVLAASCARTALRDVQAKRGCRVPCRSPAVLHEVFS